MIDRHEEDEVEHEEDEVEHEDEVEAEKEKKLIQEFTAHLKELKELKELTEIEKPNKQFKARADEIKNMALDVLNQFEKQKQTILKKMGTGVLLPAANEIVDGLSRFTNELKNHLDRSLKGDLSGSDWREQATLWAQLYAKWHDQEAIEENIVQYLAMRSSELISKDLKVIDEYQSQTLAELNINAEELEFIKKRLNTVVETHLKAMHNLKTPPANICLDKVGEWISNIQEQREHHFDSLLMRIESVVGDVKQFSDYFPDPMLEEELKNNIASLALECSEIEVSITKSPEKPLDEKNLIQIKAHLESLDEDAKELLSGSCSQELRDSLEQLKKKISSLMGKLSS